MHPQIFVRRVGGRSRKCQRNVAIDKEEYRPKTDWQTEKQTDGKTDRHEKERIPEIPHYLPFLI